MHAISIHNGTIWALEGIVNNFANNDVKETFKNLKAIIQEHQTVPTVSRGAFSQSQQSHPTSSRVIQIPLRIRQMLLEVFGRLPRDVTQSFLQTLGTI